MQVEIRDHDIIVRTGKETAEKIGAYYMDKDKYKLPKNLAAVTKLLEFSNNIDLEPLKWRMEVTKEILTGIKRQEDIVGLAHIFPQLRPYQRVDIHFLSKIPHAGMFNEQRTGKTPTLISLMKLKKFSKVVLAVPAGLTLNWEEEWNKWHGEIKAIVIKGGKKAREKLYEKALKQEHFVLIISYDTLKAEGEIENLLKASKTGQIDALAIDEAHLIRNRKSQRTKAVKKLGGYAKHRYALTGTPSVKDGYDVWSILNFLYPDKFSSYWAFLDRYFEMKKNIFSESKQPTGRYIRRQELEDTLALMSTNRKRKEVMHWLPDKTYQTIPIELTPKQRKAYNDIMDTFEYIEDRETIVSVPSVLAQSVRLRQVCLAPSLLGIKAPSAKEQFLLEWLENNPEPVIVFSYFTSYLKHLELLIEENLNEWACMIHGEMSREQRQQSKEDFQSGKARILLANIKAAGTGHTLDRAETTIFLDKEWNPTDNIQAEDRMIPTTKERNHKTHVISLVAKGTYDEYIDDLLRHKFNVTEIVNSGGIRAIERIYKELQKNKVTL